MRRKSAIPIQHVKFPESEVGVGWPAVGHRIDLRGVPVGLHVLLSAEQKDTKQPCSVLASFLAVVEKTAISTPFQAVLPPSGLRILAESRRVHPLSGTPDKSVAPTSTWPLVSRPKLHDARTSGFRPGTDLPPAGYCHPPTAD